MNYMLLPLPAPDQPHKHQKGSSSNAGAACPRHYHAGWEGKICPSRYTIPTAMRLDRCC